MPAACMLSEVIGFGPQPNKAIVGRNAFAHEAGIHQHGVISNPLCYEIMTPESVGVCPATILYWASTPGDMLWGNVSRSLAMKFLARSWMAFMFVS